MTTVPWRRAVLSGFPLRLTLLALAALLLRMLLVARGILRDGAGWLGVGIELIVACAAVRLLGWLLLSVPERLGLWRGPSKILTDLLQLVIVAALTVVIVQQRAQINLVGLVTTSAVLTAVVGLAAQETLKDLFAGITLQLDPPFREGDWIDFGEVRGTVTQLTLMNTHLTAMDGAQVVLSNSTVAQETLRRFRPGAPMGLRFSLGLDYGLPPSEALALLHRVLNLHPDVLAEPPPSAWIGAYGDSSITYEVMVFQQQLGDRAIFDLRSTLLEQIWYALERIGQSVPFPVVELRRRQASPTGSMVDFSRAGNDHRAALLARNPLLQQLNLAERQQLAGMTRCLRFAAGEVIVREGDPGDALYQVISGSVEVLKASASGGTQRVAQLGVNDVFGEMTLCVDEPRNATVRAQEQTVLLEVERQDLVPLITSDPALLERIATLVSTRRSQLQHLAEAEASSLGDSLLKRMQQLFSAMGGPNV